MVRKLTPTIGRWGKCSGTTDTHSEFQRSASRALAALPSNSTSWREDLARQLTDNLLDGRTLDPRFADAVCTAVTAIVAIETQPLQPPRAAPADTLGAVTHRLRLRGLLAFKDNADQLLRDWLDAVARILRLVIDAAPTLASESTATPALTVPLIDLMKNPTDAVQQIVSHLLRFASDDPYAVRPGAVLAHRVQHALLAVSKLTDDAARKNPNRLVAPADSGFTGLDLVDAYLGHTPFLQLLSTPTPLVISRDTFCEHSLVIAASGGGKTQYLQSLVLDFINEPDPPAVFIVDSQDDDQGILHKLAHLDVFHPEHGRLRDRLLILSPEDKPALNLFNFTTADDTERDELFTYLASAIDRQLTTKMATAATYILQLLDKLPNPTLHTFKDILENPSNYADYINQLDDIARGFFNNQFAVKGEMGATRLQVASRIYTVLGKREFRDMFAAEHNCFDAFKAMQEKKIVLVNTSRRLLGKIGSQVFGRYIVAQCMAAAVRRGAVRDRDLALLILDEAHAYYDEQTEDILRTARKFKLGFISATQMYEAIPGNVKTALAANTSIKLAGAVTDDDATHLAKNMRTTKDAVLASGKGEFMTFVRGLTPHAVRLKVKFGALEAAPMMDEAAYQRMRAINKARVTAPATGAGRPIVTAPRQLPPPNLDPPHASTSLPFTIKPGKDWD